MDRSEKSSSLDGRVWFITGASSGIGYELANAVLGRGGRVVATSRNTAAMEGLGASARDRVLVLPLDVTKDDQVKSAVTEGLRRFGTIDVLVNNAGYGLIGSVEEPSDVEIHQIFDVNFYGQVRLIKALLPHMRGRRCGCIVNLSSVAAVTVPGGAGYYVASKLAVEGMSEALRLELAPLGIRVLIVVPSASRTSYITKGYLVYSKNSIPDYESTSGMMRRVIPGSHGSQRGDPQRVAQVIVDAVESSDAPHRLILGREAVDGIRQKLNERLEELDKWAPRSIAADFPSQ